MSTTAFAGFAKTFVAPAYPTTVAHDDHLTHVEIEMPGIRELLGMIVGFCLRTTKFVASLAVMTGFTFPLVISNTGVGIYRFACAIITSTRDHIRNIARNILPNETEDGDSKFISSFGKRYGGFTGLVLLLSSAALLPLLIACTASVLTAPSLTNIKLIGTALLAVFGITSAAIIIAYLRKVITIPVMSSLLTLVATYLFTS
jgi:hypothetical protein